MKLEANLHVGANSFFEGKKYTLFSSNIPKLMSGLGENESFIGKGEHLFLDTSIFPLAMHRMRLQILSMHTTKRK